MSPEAVAGVLDRLRGLGCTPELVADAEAGRIDPLDLVKWVGCWAEDRRRPGRCVCGLCGRPCGVLVSRCRSCLLAEEGGN